MPPLILPLFLRSSRAASLNHFDKPQEIVRESQRRRFARVEDVDDVIAMDAKWRDARWELDQLNQEFNKVNKEVSKLKAAKQDADELIAKVKEIDERRKKAEAEEKEAEETVNKLLVKIGNLVHDSVPVSDDEENNVVHKTFMLDTKRMEDKLPNHVDLIAMLGIADTERGVDVAGGRGYFLTGAGVLLNQAMINYALTFLAARGHTPLATPFFMRKDRMAECAQLADFDEQLYKVTGEGDDKYLIATSEQTCCSYLRKRWIQPKELPMRFAGYSSCFRKEAGSHGRDTLGIFRVHQFEKVEQFVAVSPEGDASWKEMDRMLQNSEDFYQSLGIPYQVVNIVSGELNDAAAKKYDLEAWFPSSKTWRELVSCSNCTDFQSRRLEIRHGAPKKGPENKKSYVHLLNSTLTATERSLCCILENWQTPDGFVVPPALRPWMMGIEFIPFIKKLDKKGKLVDVTPPPPPLYGPGAGVPPPSPPTAILRPGCAESRAIRVLCAEGKMTDVEVVELPAADAPLPAGIESFTGGAPAYVEGDLTLCSGVSILRHIATTHPGPHYPKQGTTEAAKCEQVLEWCGQLAAALRKGGEAATAVMQSLEQQCTARAGGFLAGGGKATVADVLAACHVVAAYGETVPQAGPNTAAWLAKTTGGLKTWAKSAK